MTSKREHLASLLMGVILLFPALVMAESESAYFPEGLCDSTAIDWWGRAFSAMQEPSLYQDSRQRRSIEVYRCTYFPPYSGIVALRLERKPDGSGILYLRKIEQVREGVGYAPGRITRQAKFLLSRQAVDRFISALDQWKFWGQSKDSGSKAGCLGGDAWLYEGVKNGKYHLTEVDDCGEEQLPGREPAMILMKLAGEQLPD